MAAVREKILLLSAVFLLLNGIGIFAQEQQAYPYPDEVQPYAAQNSAGNFTGGGSAPGLGIFRGVFSVVQSPAELVRGYTLVYSRPDAASMIFPLWNLPRGILTGTVNGCVYFATRCSVGLVDILCFGFVPLYSSSCPPFIWESQWRN